jgi:hypothetical protein
MRALTVSRHSAIALQLNARLLRNNYLTLGTGVGHYQEFSVYLSVIL